MTKMPPMKPYLRSRLFTSGVILLLVGTGPLASVMIAGKLGVIADPNPNPVAFGVLAFLTFWPSIFLIVAGVLRIRRSQHAPQAAADTGEFGA